LQLLPQQARGLVAPARLLFQTLHHDPVEVPPHHARQLARLHAPLGSQSGQLSRGRQLLARLHRLVLANDPAHFLVAHFHQLFLRERRRSSQKFVQQDTERVDVAASIDLERSAGRLLGRGVFEGADAGFRGGVQRLVRQLLPERLGQPEIDDLGDGFAVNDFDEHVARLDVAVDDAFLVRMLYGVTYRDEQVEPLLRRELFLIAILRDRHALDAFHDKVRPAAGGDASVEHLGDVGVIHDGKGLPLGVEARQHVAAVHAELDELHCNGALDRVFLLRGVDDPHAALADLRGEGVLVVQDRADRFAGIELFEISDDGRQIAFEIGIGAHRPAIALQQRQQVREVSEIGLHRHDGPAN
jgi:hypothetical protein